MRLLLIPLAILILVLGGCVNTQRKHNAKHVRSVRQNLRELHESIDRTLFD